MPRSTEEIYQDLLEQARQNQQQANDYLNQYDNRDPFSYNPMEDSSYLALRDQAYQNGQRAMKDTMGQAAGLTGGYGSSYSQSAGNQAFNQYLTNLNAQIPALAQNARAAYDAEGDRLLNRYNLAMSAAENAYGQARDALGDVRYEQEQEYNRGRDAISDARYQQEWEAGQAYQRWQMDRTNQQDAREYALMMIQMGQMPSEDALAATGWNLDDVQAMVNYYAQQIANSGRSGGYYTGGTTPAGTNENPTVTPYDWDAMNSNIGDEERQYLLNYAKQNGAQALIELMQSRYKNADNYEEILNWINYKLTHLEPGERIDMEQ